jgi:uncharacterized protein DUF3551
MIRILLIAGVAMSVMPLNATSVKAAERPWCAVISLGPGSVYEDCQYSSFEACRPVVLAGNRGFCNHNPRYVGPATATRRAHHKRKIQYD